MSRPVTAFLDEVVEFLDDEILPDAYTDERYFDKCETRVQIDEERVSITFLSHCARSNDGRTLRVNDLLKRSEIRLEFQFQGDRITGSWTEALVQCTIGLHVPGIETPFVLKWEHSGGEGGVLKADEWFDHDREYIDRGVQAETAIEMAIWEHLETTIPSLQDQTTADELPSNVLKVLFNDDHEILATLDPIPLE